MRLASAIALLVAGVACSAPSGTVGSGYTKILETLSDPPTKLDILFVIDDSASTTDDQLALVDAARTELFSQLAMADGSLPDLHLAVVSTSVDVPGSHTPGCDDAYLNPADSLPDGLFLLGPWQGRPAGFCTGITGNYLSDAPDGAGGRTTNFTGTIEDAFACIAHLGNNGCGYEQPLEAMRRALSGEHPENAGFLRDDAMLLVVFLGDEDDSSIVDGTLWQPGGSDAFDSNDREFEYGVTCDPDDASVGPRTDCKLRENPTVIHRVGEYVTFLKSLKGGPSLVMVAGITSPPGPVNVIPVGHGSQVHLDGTCTPPPGPCVDDPTMLCERQPVEPAVRLDAFLTEFPARYVFTSICDQDMPARVHRIARAVHGAMTNDGCLAGDTPVVPDSCGAYDVAPDGPRQLIPLTLRDDATRCDYTASHLRADFAPSAPGHHVEVYCTR